MSEPSPIDPGSVQPPPMPGQVEHLVALAPMVPCSLCGESVPETAERCPHCNYPLTEKLRASEAARLRHKFLRVEPKDEPPIELVDWVAYGFFLLLWPLCVIFADKLHWGFSLGAVATIIAAGVMTLFSLVKGQIRRAIGYVLSTILGLGFLMVCWVAMERYL